MVLQPVLRVLLAAAILAVSGVQASPFWAMNVRDSGLSPRDTTVLEQCSDLVVGKNRSPDIGSVCVTLTGGTLTIKYTIDPTPTGWTINKVHAWVGTVAPTSSNPGTNPGGFPYSSDKGNPPVCTVTGDGKMATCTIPIPDAWRGCTGTLWIIAHADVTGPGGVQQTAWDNGPCYETNTNGNCAKAFTVDRSCHCPLEIDFFPIITDIVSITTITGSSTSSFLTSTTISFDTSTTSEYNTSTTVVYTTSTTSTYVTSTTVVFDTSTTSEYLTSTTVVYPTSTTSEYYVTGSSTSTTTSTSIYPTTISFPPTTTTIPCSNPSPGTSTTTVSTTLPATTI